MIGEDRGAGTVAVIGVAAVIIGLAGMLAPVSAISVARHRAAAAADAAALAAAAAVAGFGPVVDDPCASAEMVADAGGAALVACDLNGLVVTIQAAVETAFGLVAARATAGPLLGG